MRAPLVATLFIAGCGSGQSLALDIKAPCNAEALGASGVAFVELRVESDELDAPFVATFGAGDAQGTLDDVLRVSRATIQVAGRESGSNGSPSTALVAGGVGYLDLTTVSDTLAMIAGPVDTFVRTTATADGSCSDHVEARSLHTASVLDDGRVLVVGGAGSSGVLTSTEIYAPANGTFSAGPQLGAARLAHTATTLRDGTVLVAGGIGSSGSVVASFEVFDGASFGAVQKSSARAYHSATRLQDGRVLLAGGTDGIGVLATSEIYDPSTGEIARGPTLNVARARHSAVLISDAVVALVGGVSDDDVLAETELVDVAGGKSYAGPDLATARSDAMITFLVARDAVVVAGGFTTRVDDAARGTATDSIEVIDVSGSLSRATIACSDAKLIEARAAAVFADIPNGMVVAGGVSSPGQVSTSAETLDFEAGPCRPTINGTDGDLFASRFAGASAVLASGDILITGGVGVNKGTTVSRESAELFIIER